MQEKNATFLDFLQRTDRLAVSKGLNVGDLIPLLGISRAALFSYRTGKRPISSKAWCKLEAAEKEAGIAAERPQVAVFPSPQSVDLLPRASPQTADLPSPPPPDRIEALEKQVSELVAAMREQTEQIQKLLDQRATSSPGRGQGAGSKGKKFA